MLTPALRPALIAASIAWAALLLLAPLVAAQPQAPAIGHALVFAVYAIGSVVCHQRPERSFFLWSYQMPVCARCAGIYAGAAAVAIAALAWPRVSDRGLTHLSAARLRAILAVAALPAAASLFCEWTTGQMPSHWTRAATGVPLGAAVAWTLISLLASRTRAADQVN